MDDTPLKLDDAFGERQPPRTEPRYSATFTPAVNAEIRRAAATGIYDIRGGGAKRAVPHFDDLLFL
ncbi:MAG: FMN-binding glutamate synthase family protein, partial [Pseudomonadota bacterium]